MPEPAGYRPQPLPVRLARAARRRGVRPVAGDLARWAARLAAGLPWTVRGAHREFSLDGESYPYLFHPYKRTWLTERAVEVPVVGRIVDAERGRVLEVGNVLSHYRPQAHTVVDKYERAPGVLNRDVSDLGDLGPFDLVVAISTLEHVGWDEEPRRPELAVAALGSLRSLLAPGGRLVVTIPAGYNPLFDGAFRDGTVRPSRIAALRRVPGTGRWEPVPPEVAWAAPYDFLIYSARGVLVATFEGPEG